MTSVYAETSSALDFVSASLKIARTLHQSNLFLCSLSLSEYDLPEEERRFYKFTWDSKNLIFPDTSKASTALVITQAPCFGFTLPGISLQRAELTGSALAFSDLTGVDFTQANLKGCNLAQATLTQTNFQHTRCEGAVFNGCKVGNAIFDGTYMTGAKSCEKMKDFDPLPWRTKYRLDNGDDVDSDDDEEEDDDADAPVATDLVSPKRAIQRQASIAQSDKDKLRDHINEVIMSDMNPSEMVTRIMDEVGEFKVEDIENVLEIMSVHTLDDNDGNRDQHFWQKKKHLVANLHRKLHRYKEQAFHDRIFAPTVNFIVQDPSMSQRFRTFMQHSSRDPQSLRRCSDEIRDVMAQLQEMRGAFLKETWVDQVDEWQELCLLQKGLTSQRAMMVLRCIFEDKDVMKSLGMACQMKSIRGVPPDGLMLRLKEDLGAHLKKVRSVVTCWQI
jgi:uncharacterized protein YjbI with pentapeptide repeats